MHRQVLVQARLSLNVGGWGWVQGWQSLGEQEVGLFAITNLSYLDASSNFAPHQKLNSGERLPPLGVGT